MANKITVTEESKKELDKLMHKDISTYRDMNYGRLSDTYEACYKGKYYTITRKDMPARKVDWWKYITQLWDKDAELEIKTAKPTTELCAWNVETGALEGTRRIETALIDVKDPEERMAVRYSVMKSMLAEVKE
jgi:hypothetical protein